MNTLMVIPPYVLEDGKAIAPNKAMLPVGPLSIAGSLARLGDEVTVVDLVFSGANWQDELSEAVLETRPEHVLLSCHTPRNIPICVQAQKVIGNALQARDTHVTLGGNAAQSLGLNDFNSLGLEVDTLVRGYGHGCYLDISGCVSGEVMSERISPILHLPETSLLNPSTLEQYLYRSDKRYPVVGPGGFGCTWACSYCSAQMGSSSQPRSFNEIRLELDLAQKLGYEEIWCVDNLVFVNPHAVKVFDDECYRRGLTWSGMTRHETLNQLDDNFLQSLSACKEIAIGVETASPAILRSLKRGGYTEYLEGLQQAFGSLRDSGVSSNAFVMLDIPGTGEGEFDELFRLLSQLKPDTVSWSFYNPDPLTAVSSGIDLASLGFYRWPLGCSKVSPERVVQQAILLSGRFWSGWQPAEKPFLEEADTFGIRFEEAVVVQDNSARSAVGDLWEVWRERRAR